jgi:fucose permease
MILMTDLIGCVVSVGLMVILPGRAWALWAGSFGFGFFIASVFPTVITWTERRMTMSGLVTSMFLVGASLCAIFFPWFIGQLFDRYGPGITMPTILTCLLASCVVLVLLMASGGPPKIEVDETA